MSVNKVPRTVTISNPGLVPTLPNDGAKYLDGTGLFSVPAGAGGGTVTQVNTDGTYSTGGPITTTGTIDFTVLSKSAINSALHSLLGGI